MTDSSEVLRAAAAAKKATAYAKAMRAITAMRARGQTINFNTVAKEAGVSKGYLYRQPDLKRLIADERPAPSVVTRSRQEGATRDKVAEQKLRLAMDAIKRLKEENETLRKENAALRGDIVALRRRIR